MVLVELELDFVGVFVATKESCEGHACEGSNESGDKEQEGAWHANGEEKDACIDGFGILENDDCDERDKGRDYVCLWS